MQNIYPNHSTLAIADFDYPLPEERIAKYPLAGRDQSKLLVYRNEEISHSAFSLLPNYLEPNQLMVVNNTKVIPSRLWFRKQSGSVIQVFCLEPHNPSDYALALQATKTCTWKCLVGNLKRWKAEPLTAEFNSGNSKLMLNASKLETFENYVLVKFDWAGEVSFAEVLEIIGETPIPPYLNRRSEEIDRKRYQTVYSQFEGSVAAPTAGLHFTNSVLDELNSKSIQINAVTLHVGAGTFKPVQSNLVVEHQMHSELFDVSKETLQKLHQHHNAIVSVGTTSLRTLESLYWMALKVKLEKPDPAIIGELHQWEAYNLKPILSYSEAMEVLIDFLESNHLTCFRAKTKLMVLPGYTIRSANALITNFHQPKSTLLLLVSAFIGDNWLKVYQYALENNFRFLSYGDSSLLFRSK